MSISMHIQIFGKFNKRFLRYWAETKLWRTDGRNDRQPNSNKAPTLSSTKKMCISYLLRCWLTDNKFSLNYTNSKEVNFQSMAQLISPPPNRPWAGYRPPPPRGNFVHYDFLKLHYIRHNIKYVSPLRVAALLCNITLYTLPPPPRNSIKRPW